MKLLPVARWASEFPSSHICQCNKNFMNETKKKLVEYLVRLSRSKSDTFCAKSARDTTLICAEASKEAIFCKGINIRGFLVDSRVPEFFTVRHIVCLSFDFCEVGK